MARKITKLLELKFSVWKFKFGLDPLLGLVPGLGDTISLFLSCYLVFVAILYKIPLSKIVHMIFNILLDFTIGLFPVIGDMLDFVLKPNVWNLAILEKEIKTV